MDTNSMAIRRSKRKTKFTIIGNTGLHDERLSWKAKGLLAYMLSLPDDWVFYQEELTNHATDGIDSTKSGLNELERCGYLIKQQGRDNKGKFSNNDWEIFDEPQEDNPLTENPLVENPLTDKPTADNPMLLSTNITKDLKELSTKDTKYPKKTTTKRFSKPSIDDLQQYITDSNFNIDAQHFYDYYESKGWLVGKSPMKDWKATVRNWNRRNKEVKQNSVTKIVKKANDEKPPEVEITDEERGALYDRINQGIKF